MGEAIRDLMWGGVVESQGLVCMWIVTAKEMDMPGGTMYYLKRRSISQALPLGGSLLAEILLFIQFLGDIIG